MGKDKRGNMQGSLRIFSSIQGVQSFIQSAIDTRSACHCIADPRVVIVVTAVPNLHSVLWAEPVAAVAPHGVLSCLEFCSL